MFIINENILKVKLTKNFTDGWMDGYIGILLGNKELYLT